MTLVFPILCLMLVVMALANLLVNIQSIMESFKNGMGDYVQLSGLTLLAGMLTILIVYLVLLIARLAA